MFPVVLKENALIGCYTYKIMYKVTAKQFDTQKDKLTERSIECLFYLDLWKVSLEKLSFDVEDNSTAPFAQTLLQCVLRFEMADV